MMSSSTDFSPPWVELPREITAVILRKLGVVEILTVAQKVCTTWRSVCTDQSMWRSVEMGRDLYLSNHPGDLDKMCRRAVDLSQGQLIDILVYYFCEEDLLIYISERCPQLKRLELQHCDHISEEAWSEALQNLPLEELHLEYTPVDPSVIEKIGTSCPLLKSFKLNQGWDMDPLPSNLDQDHDAEQIAQGMPQLLHLELMGNQMSNKGLQAILDGCPQLETLDLRECFNVNFSGDIAKTCSQRIKDLRCPLDAIVGGVGHLYPFDDDYDDYSYRSPYSDIEFGSDYEDYLEFSDGGSMDRYDYLYDYYSDD